MSLKGISKTFLLVISAACVANASLATGEQGQDQFGLDQYQPGYIVPGPGPGNGPGYGGPDYGPPPPPPNYPPHEQPPYGPQPPCDSNPYEPNPCDHYQPGPPPPPHYGNQSVEINVYRSLYGNDRVDLTQYVDLYRYRGYRVDQVLISGSAQYNASFITLVVNGNNMGQVQFNGGYSQRQSIWLRQRPMIGNGADSIVLYSQGNMTIEHVTLLLSR